MRRCLAPRFLVLAFALACSGARAADASKADVLWQKLDARIAEVDGQLDGAMGVSIRDLGDGRAVMRVHHQVARCDDRGMLGGQILAPAKQDHVARRECVRIIERKEMPRRGLRE